ELLNTMSKLLFCERQSACRTANIGNSHFAGALPTFSSITFGLTANLRQNSGVPPTSRMVVSLVIPISSRKRLFRALRKRTSNDCINVSAYYLFCTFPLSQCIDKVLP